MARASRLLVLLLVTASVSAFDLPSFQRFIKYTVAVTDPHAALRFIQAYFPVLDCEDPRAEQKGFMCNGTMTCGPIGRSQLIPQDHSPKGFSFPHMVNSSARPVGGLSVDKVEAHFDEKLAGMRQYDAFMDYSLVVLSGDLASWIKLWQRSGVDFFPLTWYDDIGIQYWSVIVRVPSTQVIVEVVTAAQPPDKDLLQAVEWHTDNLQRLPNSLLKGKHFPEGTWATVAVSKFTSDLDTIIEFYTDVMGAASEFAHATNDGVRMATVSWPHSGGQAVRLVMRPASNTSGSLSVAALERSKFEAHNMTLGRSFEESALCGVSKWYDNHWGLMSIGGGVNYGSVLRKLRARDWPYLQLWATSGVAFPNVYVVDPSGDAIQLNSKPGYLPFQQPAWTKDAADDALCGLKADDCDNGLCTQGNCTAVSPPTSASCEAALTRLCPDLKHQLMPCSDCVYHATTFAALRSQGCFVADTYIYCTPPNKTFAAPPPSIFLA